MWALGVVLYELLALCHPFEARNQVKEATPNPNPNPNPNPKPNPNPNPNQAALVLKIVRGQYEPPAGDYSAGLVRLLDMCLAHDLTRTRTRTLTLPLTLPLTLTLP